MKTIVLTLQATFMLLIAATCARLFFDGDEPVAHDSMFITGWVLCFLGLGLIAWGVISLRGNFTVFVSPRDQLVTTGAYRITRNPLYFGGLFICFGWAISLHSIACTFEALILVFILNVKVRLEEAELSKKFGAHYDAYRAKTARWLKLFS